MTIIEALASLGFTNAENLGVKSGQTLVKVMTSKGWAYERFAKVDDVTAWARSRNP